MNVVICSLNSKYIHSSLAPWCLLSGVRNYCSSEIKACVVEGTVNESQQNIVNRITEKSPDVVSFCCYIWNITAVKEVAQKIKAVLPDIKLVFGGPEVSYCAKEFFKTLKIADYVISGEGEYPFSYLLNCLCENKKIDDGNGICYKNGESVVVNEPYIHNYEVPSPYCDEYFENLRGRISYIETSRGCPYSCAFCLSGRCGGVRHFDIERVKKEILLLANSGTQTVKFVDRTFNANKKRANEIISYIIESYNAKNIPKSVCFHFEIAGDILTDDTISLLSQAPKGLFQLEIGLQSFNEKTLSYINRKTNTKRLKQNILSLLKNQNVHIHIDLIAGLPYEDAASFKESFNIAFNLKPHMLQFGFLKLLYGADMRENPKTFPCNFNKEPPYEVIDTPWLSKDEMIMFHYGEDSLDKLYNSSRFLQTLDYVIEKTGISPFELFCRIGIYIKEKGLKSNSADSYADALYSFFAEELLLDNSEIRDVMVIDRISTNASGNLPQSLRIFDKRLKNIRLYLEGDEKTRRPQGVKRMVAILYTKGKYVYVDYKNKDKVTGKFLLNFGNLSDVEAVIP